MITVKEFADLHSKVGYAIGALEAMLIWDIPAELKKKIEDAIERLKKHELS